MHVSERGVRFTHVIFFTLIVFASIVAVGISGSLVGDYNKSGYPSVAYRDRIRILLVASVWTAAFGREYSAHLGGKSFEPPRGTVILCSSCDNYSTYPGRAH